MTGSATTFDALVWGTGPDAAARRAAGTPLLDKPFTAELGGVAPIVAVPGAWTAADVRRQADVVAAAKLCNAGHICASPQVLVLPEGWTQGDALLDELRALLRTLDSRAPYYPGTQDKIARVLTGQPGVETLLEPGHRLLVPGLDPAGDCALFRDEVFADVLGVVRVPAPDVDTYLARAVGFVNDRLAGTLAATLLVDPVTAREHAQALDRAVTDLRYGSVGVNAWPIVSFFLGYPSWGAYPGHTCAAVGSGIGTVLNPYLLPDPEKSVVTGTFRPKVTPLTSVHNRTALTTWRRLLGYWATDDVLRLPGVLASALLG
jgi:acyl-CoA reductase-like NAD-dependent aldehyde dehydrogenase